MENVNLTQLGNEAYQWEGALTDIFNLKNRTFSAISHEENVEEASEKYNVLLDQCAEALTSIPFARVPTHYLEERKEHKSLIIGEIDKRVTEYHQTKLTVHLEKIISSIFDYGYGPIILYEILNSPKPEQTMKEFRERGIEVSYGYAKSYEETKSLERQRLLKNGIIPKKMYGRGESRIREPEDLCEMVFNLYEFSQPKLFLTGLSEEKINSIRLNVEEQIDKLYKLKERLGRRLKGRVMVPLITNPKIKELFLNEIRPRNVFDVYPSHPLRLKIDNMFEKDEKYQKKTIKIVSPYMIISGHGRYCSQAVIWDVLYLNRLFGEHKLPIVDTILVGLGYDPISVSIQTNYEKPPSGMYA